MAILYAQVARGTTVLAEFSAVSGNTGAVARRILEKLPAEDESRLCFSQDRYIFHILRSESITFLCMANDTFGRRIPFAYLEDIQMRFMKNYGKVASYAPAYAMNDEFSRVLHQQMEFFSSNPSADTLNRVRSEVGEVRTIMVDNIEKILERGDRIELLVDKTSTMQDSAFHFKKQSKRLRRALWMKNAKLLALLTGLIFLLLYIIVAACCGGGINNKQNPLYVIGPHVTHTLHSSSPYAASPTNPSLLGPVTLGAQPAVQKLQHVNGPPSQTLCPTRQAPGPSQQAQTVGSIKPAYVNYALSFALGLLHVCYNYPAPTTFGGQFYTTAAPHTFGGQYCGLFQHHQQPTNLASMFSKMSLQPPSQDPRYYMNSGASSHSDCECMLDSDVI